MIAKVLPVALPSGIYPKPSQHQCVASQRTVIISFHQISRICHETHYSVKKKKTKTTLSTKLTVPSLIAL